MSSEACKSADRNKFTITKGVENIFVFTIKADGSALPAVLVAGDTIKAIFRKLSDSSVILEKNLTISLVSGPGGVMQQPDGKAELVLSVADTNSFTVERGAKEDRYYSKPICSLVLECNTSANGKFLARVPHVFID